jgi:adenylate cyclase class 2
VITSDNREIEIKLYAPDLELIRTRLEAAGAMLTHPRVYERNIRYDNAAQTLVNNGIIIRLRQDSRARLTYKEPGTVLESGIYARYEAEVEVGDFDTMHTILLKLGFAPSMIYEKYRTTYQYDDAEIVLDEMPYGHFIEVEGDEAAIQRAVERLDLGGMTRFNAGYAALFENVRRNLGLTFRDLTFANFSGILVTEDALKSPKL